MHSMYVKVKTWLQFPNSREQACRLSPIKAAQWFLRVVKWWSRAIIGPNSIPLWLSANHCQALAEIGSVLRMKRAADIL